MAGRSVGPFDRSLADRVRFARRVAGMSQRDLAAAIGSRVPQVRRYETGTAAISAATLLRIAVALDTPLAWLYGVDDSDLWPDSLIASVFHDKQMPALVSAFSRIADGEARSMVLDLVQGLGNKAQPRPQVPVVPLPATPTPDGRRKRAMLVDDAPDVLVVVGAFLRSGGFDVIRAHGADAALDIIRRDEPIDVLVTDFDMPDMSGLELVHRAASLRPGLPAVMITAFAADLALAAGRQPGIMTLAKPFARADLLNAVNAVCAGAEAGARGA